MKIKVWLTVSIIIFVIQLVHPQKSYDAIVASLKGKALFRTGEDGKASSLNKNQELFADDWVYCGKGCQELILYICNKPFPVLQKNWKQIRSRGCNTLDEYRLGRSKGEDTIIISPQESEIIEPESFSLRWKPTKSSVKLDIALGIQAAQKTIFVETDIDGSKGSFKSPELLKKLKAEQQAGRLNLEITLIEKRAGKIFETQKIAFQLISVEDQKELSKDLKSFENEIDELFKSIDRGLTFGKYSIFTEAARELEKALKISQRRAYPKETTTAITELVIKANYQIYNDERVRQLCRTFKDLKTQPFPCEKLMDDN